MRKHLLSAAMLLLSSASLFAQTDRYWSASTQNKATIITDRAVARLSYPKEFRLFNLNADALRQELMTIVDGKSKHSTIITLPNAEGILEQFEVYEASNFEPALQARYPQIRAFSGKGITDKYASLKLSISPQGIESMVFRTDKDNEFIEPYSKDHNIYSVYKSQRNKGNLPWTCSTQDQATATDLSSKISAPAASGSSTGQLKTMRLAQSVTAEYSNYFGATSSSQSGLVLAAVNNTLTRCNGVYEKDLGVHLNLISNTTSVFYYTASTDPYSAASTGAGGAWNSELQNTLTSVIGEANYDIGHLFGASGGGGNAGCIGCVCTNGSKGSGFTSPADGIPQGDNFDIDYVVHEVGHQMGANHTFSYSLEGTGVNKEIGSGITIMGYAGITSQDVAPHSLDIYHEASIAQIQANLATKTCPVSTDVTANNVPPVVAAVSNYTIPISTPFALTGSATDANGDALTYCWEQNDNSTTSGANSIASPTKTTGPNFLSFAPTASGTRLFPKLSTILAGLNVTPVLTGGDAGTNIEALSSVSRTLNFRLTVRDNHVYSSTAPVSVGQTAFTDMVVTVSNTSGPFAVTAPNTAITWNTGSAATVTWSVNNTTAAPVSCASVNILLSTDGGNTFPTVLASATANDGTETITVPNVNSTTCRIKVESVGNIFFDISNANFTIATGTATCDAPTGLTSSALTTSSATVSWTAVSGANSYDVDYKTTAATTWTNAATATTSTSANISGLAAGTTYDWRVRTNCASGSSGYSQAQFTTTAASGCGTAFEPNETQAAAAAISSGVTNSAAITTSTDVDYFKITTTATSNIVYNLVGPSGVDYDLYVYNSAGTQIGSSTGTTATETVTLNSQAAGTYYIKVIGYSGANSATCYTIKATATTVTSCQSSYDVSTNGTTSGAASIPFNTNITGLISPSADIDNYKFVITTGGTITLTLTTLPGDYDLKLLNSAGTQVAISQNGSTTSETINYTAAAGTYYAQVYGYNGANNASSCYTLKVQLGTATKGAAASANTAGITVSPNPAHDMLQVDATTLKAKGILNVYDAYGKAVVTKDIAPGIIKLNVAMLANGVYNLVITDKEGMMIGTVKFIKD